MSVAPIYGLADDVCVVIRKQPLSDSEPVSECNGATMESSTGSVDMSRPRPKDMSHHFSDVSLARAPNKMKEYYRFFQIPGIGQLAGGA